MESCIFCKIAKGDIPAEKSFENDEFMAFLDIHPRAPGHTLLIPKAHYAWFLDLPQDLYGRLFGVARELAMKLKGEHGADYIQLGVIGKDVPHAHVHLIPRKLNAKELPGL